MLLTSNDRFGFNSFGNIFIAIHIAILEVWFKRISLNNSIKFDILSPYSTFLFLFLVKKVFYHVFFVSLRR